MKYHFVAIATCGDGFYISGKKLLKPSATLSVARVWEATTTLVLEVKSTKSITLGSGKLKLGLKSFVDQLWTINVSGPNFVEQRRILVEFLWHFSSHLMRVFVSPLAPLRYPGDGRSPIAQEVAIGPKKQPAMQVTLKAVDGAPSTLRMWDPVNQGADSTVPNVLFVPGTAVSHLIFASPYMPENAIEHFTAKGYSCWCLTTRFGKQNHPDPPHAWTSYDARFDIAAALTYIKYYNAGSSSTSRAPYIIAHCSGSLALATALLDGTVDKTSLSGLTASQNFLHPILQPLNETKARLPLTKLYRLIAGGWLSLDITRQQSSQSLVQSALDALLRFYPLSSRREICTSSVCHRCNLVFGRLWNHANLNKATHDNLHHVFGGVSAVCMEHLALSGKKRAVIDRSGKSMSTEEGLRRLKGIPMFLFSGSDNNIYHASSTVETWRVLEARGEIVRRCEFEGLGHLNCWMSEKAAAPGGVYETVKAEVRRVMRGREEGKPEGNVNGETT